MRCPFFRTQQKVLFSRGQVMKSKNKNYVLTANIDEKMNQCVAVINKNIENGKYTINDWDSFVETALLVFSKMLDNDITPFQFDLFIESYKKNEDVCEA